MKWFLEGETVSIPLGTDPATFEQAITELVVALDLALPESAPVAEVPEPSPLADLVLELASPSIAEKDGTRRATAEARLVYRPADGGPQVRSRRFDFRAPLGPIEADDLAWYLERYASWPSPVFQRRAKGIEAKLPEWGGLLYDALAHDKTRGAIDGWAAAEGGPSSGVPGGGGDVSRRFSVLVDSDSEDFPTN